MASHLFSHLKLTSNELQRRRNRLRKVLLEALERRELLAADLLGYDDLGSPAALTSSLNQQDDLLFTSVGGQDDFSGYDVSRFLDSAIGSSAGDVTSRPWFHLIEESYQEWSRQNGLAYSYTAELFAEGEGLVAEGEPGSGGPRLLSVAPNSGDIFTFNGVNTLNIAPTELLFRFDGSSALNPNTLANGIRVIRAGENKTFEASDEVIQAGFVGLGETNRTAVFRFAATLPDDLYRVELNGFGADAVRDVAGIPLDNRLLDSTPNDTNFDTVDFRLELGALVQAVVPQPVDRAADGSLNPRRDVIRVYFNNDDLEPTSATNPNFYQLILTQDTVQPQDDVVFRPLSVSYDPAADMAELTFAGNIDTLAGGVGTFRLRIGQGDDVVSSTNPVVLPMINPTDPASTVESAFNLGTLSTEFNRLINQTVVTTNPALLPLDYPGSNFENGHRDIQDENHLGGGADSSPQITTAFYNFALDRSYGVNAAGQPVFTSITPEQMQRVREIFELYSEQAGMDFVESVDRGMTIVVGDLFPNGAISGPGGTLGVASVNDLNGLAIMDGAEDWDNSFGADFMVYTMHEIGHMLGMSHDTELPEGTFMRGSGPGNPDDLAFPGDHDVAHLQFLHRPDNRDVDLYRFTVPAGTQGTVTAEMLAERLANSSNLDSHLTLFKQNPDGTLTVVSANDDYFGEDAYLKLSIGEGTYFLGVTASGNEDYNPRTGNNGSGGTSQGLYQLRFNFKPDIQSNIVDLAGSALDGDGDGKAGGNFNFWFRTATPAGSAAPGAPKTIFVDKGYSGTQTGSPAQPYNNLVAATGAAGFGDIIRVVGSVGVDGDLTTTADNPAYEIGRGGVSNAVLSDGISVEIPRGVTMMIDAGAIFKLQGSRIVAGSREVGINREMSSIQVLGTPSQSVLFTSYDDQSLGIDTNPLPTVPQPGNWGGIEIHNDIDRAEGRIGYERKGIFLNYIANADIRYGGGRITVATPSPSINPINLSEARPTLLNNLITKSADSAISADPNSFEETLFTEARYQQAAVYQPDYQRVGPDIRGNTVIENSINGLFVRVPTLPGNQLQTLSVAGRFDDLDIPHILGENLIIQGTPGGSFLETVRPDISLVQLQPASNGGLVPGQTFTYRVTFFDRFGGESIPSVVSNLATIGAGGAIRLTNLPTATGDFVGRRLWRSANGGAGTYTLVAELDAGNTTYTDIGGNLNITLTNPGATSLQRARPDASLNIDPGIIIKSLGSRIEVGVGAQLIAEGTGENKVIFTSRYDDRYGAGGTFDTNNDLNGLAPRAADWGGLLARQLSTISLDSALVTFAGGVTTIPGGFGGFNAVEIHQAEGRIVNTVFESNANGLGGSLTTRDGRGTHEPSVIFVRAAQPVIMDNIFRNNSAPVISIDANAMKAVPVQDLGRQTGENDRDLGGLGNMGPLVRGNRLSGNTLNGLEVRGGTLTTESVWDDTDIVHVLRDEIIVENYHTFGGLRLQSRVDEGLVVKLSGNNAGFTATGTPLDIPDRVGGSIQIVGAPGFPVVLTSIRDDSVGAGFDPTGAALTDTNNNGPSTASQGDWRGIRFDEFSNDRNLDTVPEVESDQIQDSGTNDNALEAQFIGALADDLDGGDENLRLGITVHGVVASASDTDVYSFIGTAGTPVWLDIDRTDAALDSVVELIDADGRIVALSDNSLRESANGAVAFIDGSLITPESVQTLERDPFAPANSRQPGSAVDFQSVNPGDAGMRVVLPGTAGQQNTYYVRVRSSNVGPGQSAARLQDPALVNQGLTTGAYRLQLRLQQQDEIPGSTVRYADFRYAQTAIDVSGLPGHSPLLGSASESLANGSGQINIPTQAIDLGNLAASDRASFSLAGELAASDAEVDFYQFSIQRNLTQSGGQHIAATFDIDYASDFGRPNTTLWVFQITQGGYRLVLMGTDSNIADDRARPGQAGGDLDDLLRGSLGSKDAYIGTQELPDGDYIVAVSNNSRVAQEIRQFQEANPAFPLARVEPIDSIQRIVTDRFENPLPNHAETWLPPKQVAFNGNNLEGTNSVPYTLADVSTFVVQDFGNGSRLLFANALTGAKEAEGVSITRVNDTAMSPDGRLVAFNVDVTSAFTTDANSDDFVLIDPSNNGSTSSLGASGIQTFTTEQTAAGPPPTFAVRQRTKNNAQVGDGMEFHALTFYTNPSVSQTSAGDVRLFGVGQRGDGNYVFNRAILDANGAPVGFVSTVGEPTNFIYRLDPNTGAAINPAGLADRAGNNRTQGAGTQSREFGAFVTGNPFSTVTGIANLGSRLAAVSEDGELFITGSIGNGTNFIGNVAPRTIVRDPATNAALSFTGLTVGPKNLEGGRFANILFGTLANGTIYAFNEFGTMQNVFPGGNYRISAGGGDSLGGGLKGIDFSPVDVNLWHLTNTQGTVPGHGRDQTFDLSRPTRQDGTNSLYFGFENSGNDGARRQAGDWDPVHSVFDNGYNTPGGIHGAIESQTVDLRGYSAEDLPTLYFTYYLDTENSNSDLTDNNVRMKDAFRVYVAGDDGQWVQVVTNNSIRNGSYSNGVDEFDVVNYVDPYGLPLLVQEAFDVGDNAAPDSWRQARVGLAPFAGQQEVKIRFEFSTGASFRTNDPERGGVELNAVAGHRIVDGDTFTINADGDIGGGSTTFEFDLGLVLNLPGGSSIVPGSQLNLNGTTYTFSTTSGAGNNILYSLTDSPAQIAARVSAELSATFTVVTNSVRGNILNVTDAPVGTYSVLGLPTGTIQGVPGVTAAASVPVHQAMTTTQVRDAIRTALAANLNIAGQETNLDVWPVYGSSTIRMFKYTVGNAGPLSVATRNGDRFGVQLSGGGYNTMYERAQNNAGNVGVFIDDIIIGLAERGEMVSNTAGIQSQAPASSFLLSNLQYELPGLGLQGSTPNEIERGKYQLEIRTSADYGLQSGANIDLNGEPFRPSRSFDSNDRLAEQIGIQVTGAGNIADGSTFTLSDGVNLVTFEFDVTSSPSDIAAGTAAGNVPIAINASDTSAEVANKIRTAINTAPVQNRLMVSASVNGELNSSDTGSGSSLVLLHGPAALDRTGGLTFTGTTGLSIRRWGTESGFGEDLGDSNRKRDQGLLLISSSSFTDSSNYGIEVDAAARSGNTQSFPGSPVNFPTVNADRLAPGVVIVNNIIAGNNSGGILISGDPFTPEPLLQADITRPVTVARIVNNTIYGTRSGDAGIRVEQDAAPIILNNVIANTGTAIQLSGANGNRVIGGTLYFDNASQAALPGESFRLVASSSPFVNAASGFFYPSPNSLAIDSSIEALPELASLTQVKNSLGLPFSPILAPDRDYSGQRRVDDFNVAPPGGLGANAFKDRGAVERADVTNLNAVILQPQDNDSLNTDADRSTTYIRLNSGRLDYFSILLDDGDGVGPDNATVTPESVWLTENGRPLQPGVDYIFGFNANSRTLRLTPLAGIWRNDSVYEITLNNKDTLRVSMPDGGDLSDGELVTVSYPGGSLQFEMDDNGSVDAGSIAFPFSASWTAYEVAQRLSFAINSAGVGVTSRLEGDGYFMLDGATGVSTTSGATVTTVGGIRDKAGNAMFPNRATGLTQFTIVMPEVQLDFGDANGARIPTIEAATSVASNGNGARHALLPIDAPLLALGKFADADGDGLPTAAVDGDDNDSLVSLGSLGAVGGVTQGTAGPATLALPAAAALDNQSIVITDTAARPFAPVTFEFDTDGSATPSPSLVVVTLTAGDSASVVASKLAAAVNSAVLDGRLTGLIAVASGANVSLGGSAAQQVDLSSAPAVSRLLRGNVELVIPAVTTSLADGQTMTILDGSGRSVTLELNNTDPAAGVSAVTPGRVGVDVDLSIATAADVAAALASAINAQIAGRNLTLAPATVAGNTVSVLADDEDGVTFGGIFNAASNPVPITVVSTGAGMLDAWIDWNNDGDFNDSGEKLFTTSTPLQAGSNTFNIQTPAGASVGYTTARFRVSTLGGLLSNGVGIGGEVEDYLIEIVDGAPPIANSDSYTVDEDQVLSVTAAGGVLANDTDINVGVINPGVNIFVYDQDPQTTAIEPLVDVANGVLVLNRDGSFTYTPDTDFNGTDTFVYFATDERLRSNVPTTVTITINPINDVPLAVDDERTSLEDQTYIRSGNDFTANDLPHNLGHPSEAGQTLTLVGADIITEVTTDLGGIAGVQLRVGSQPGQGMYGIRVHVTSQDLGLGVAPTVSVSPDTIRVVLNSHSASPSTINDLVAAVNGDAAAAALIAVSLDAGAGTTVIGNAATTYSPLLVPPRGGSVSVAANQLRYTPPAQYNQNIGGPVLLRLTIEDDATAGPVAGLQATSTLTLNLSAVNDSPEFSAPSTVVRDEDVGPVSIPNFITNAQPGAARSTDEGTGPAVVQENQQLTYSVRALNPDPSLYTVLPSIDASGTLTYELAPDVNRVTPFPALLVEVIAIDNGAVGRTNVVINRFDPSRVFPSTPNMYDGATMTVVDTEGNTVIVELEDATNFAGVGSTAGFPHLAVSYNASDTANSLSQKIVAAINNPPTANIRPGGAGTWTASAYVDAVTGEIKFSNEASVAVVTPPAVTILQNNFPALAGGTTYDGATFTLTDVDGNFITFEFNDTTVTAPATAGVALGHVAINYAPTFTQEQLSQAIHAAINNPPAALAASWDVQSVLPAASNRLQLTGVSNSSLSASTATIINPLTSASLVPVFAQRQSNESVAKTFTILHESVNDAPEFTLGATPVSLEDEGLIVVPGFMSDIRRGRVTSIDELVQILSVSVTVADPSAFTVLPTIDLATGNLTYQTAPNANRATGHVFDATVTVTDNGGTARGGVDSATDTFTLDIIERNDAPEFQMPTAISNTQEVLDPTVPVVIPGFITNIMPGPGGAATDEGAAVENQQVRFRVRALNESLFSILPTIQTQADGTGTLTYRLADDVNQQIPFPTILVEVVGADDGVIGNGSVIINHFDPSSVFPFVPNVYDGATLTVVDTNGNTVIFELDDAANLPGVGSTAGFPHVAIPYSAADTVDTLNARIANAIDNPPVPSINPGGAAWTVNAYADAVSHEIRFTGEASVDAAAPAAVTILQNLFPALSGGQTYDGATITITDVDGDSITFEFNDTTNTAPATAGVMPGHVAIDYTPAFTANQLSQALHNIINNPPAALAANWDVTSVLPGGSDRLQLSNVADVRLSVSTASVINPLSSRSISQVFTERLANEAAPRTFAIVPDPINDAPEFTITQPLITGIREDQGQITINDFITGARPGPITALDELALQTLSIEVIALDPSAFKGAAGQPRIVLDQATGKGVLTFTTNDDVNDNTGHDLRVRVILRDDGGVRPGSPDVDTTEDTFTISVAPINDAPTFTTTASVTVFEDNEQVTLVSPTVIPNFATFTVGPATAVDETTDAVGPPRQLPIFSTLSVSNPNLFDGAAGQPRINQNGELVFTTKLHQNGSAVVVVRMSDNGPGVATGNGDDNQARPDRTFTITLTPVNDRPEFTISQPATSREDQGLVQIPGFLTNMRAGPVEATDESGQQFTVHVEAVDPSVVFILPPEISATGTLRYQTGPDVNRDNADLRVRVWLTDDGTAPAAGIPDQNRSLEQTFLLDVEPINDAPLFDLTATQVTVIEDVEEFEGTSNYSSLGFATNIAAGPATATDELLTQTSTLRFEVVSVSAPELFSAQPAISPTGELTFHTAQHRNGSSAVVVRLVDSGPSSPPPNDNDSTLKTFTITITPINDAPQFSLPPAGVTVDEDAGLISRNGFATNVRRGPVGTDDENSQSINFVVTAVDPALFLVQPAIGIDGTLTFQTAPNVNSLNSQLLVDVTLVDNGLSAPAPNTNQSVTQRFTITVNAVNDDPIPDSFQVAGTEDSPITIQAADVLVGDSPGPTSDEAGQTLRMTQIERTSAAGGRITPVFSGTTIVSFTYTPPADLVGTDTILYVVTDNGTPNRSGTGTITITLEGINDPPQFTKGSDQVVAEDAPAVTVPGWATGILAGPPAAVDEHATQTVTFTVTATPSNLFAVQPAVSSNGTLTYQPALNANGTAVVTVLARDNGSPAAQSAAQTFTISLSPVNDAPVFTAGGNVTVLEDSGSYSQTWATNIAPAAGLLTNPQTALDEAGQVVDFTVVVDRPQLFSVQPTISSSGSGSAGGVLNFTPTENAFGNAVITVTAVDRGPAGGQNVNSSTPLVFTISLTPVNDAPMGQNDVYSTNENAILNVPAPGLLSNDTDVDLPADTISVVAGSLESTLGAQVTLNADGSMRYDPSNVLAIQQLTTGQNVLDSFVYRVRDAAGATSAPVTVSINVAGVDDAPVAVADAYSIGVGQSRLLDVLANDSDIDSAIDPRTITITQVPVFGSVTVNQTGVIQYVAGVGFRGIDTFSYTVRDLAGNVSNEAPVTVTVNNAPIANDDSVFTFKNESVDINVLGNDTDLDGSLNPATVEVVVAPTPGGTTQVLPGGVIRFTPAVNFAGQAQFSYVVSDNVGTPSNVATVRVRVQNSKWQNPQGSLDVNADGIVSPIDALLLINYLNSGAETFLPSSGVTPPPYLDPSGDESISPVDVLLVINFLNDRSGGGAAEGEDVGSFRDYAMMVTPEQMLRTVGTQVAREVQAVLDESLQAALGEEVNSGQTAELVATAATSLGDAGDDLLDLLYCSHEEFQSQSVEEAVDEFFDDIGPVRPV